MKISIEATLPNTLPNKAKAFLAEAARQTPFNNFTFKEYLHGATKGDGTLFLVFSNNNLVGCFYIIFRVFERNRIATVALYGGECIELWCDDMVQYLIQCAKANGCSRATLFAPKGAEINFPEFGDVGLLLSKDIVS